MSKCQKGLEENKNSKKIRKSEDVIPYYKGYLLSLHPRFGKFGWLRPEKRVGHINKPIYNFKVQLK